MVPIDSGADSYLGTNLEKYTGSLTTRGVEENEYPRRKDAYSETLDRQHRLINHFIEHAKLPPGTTELTSPKDVKLLVVETVYRDLKTEAQTLGRRVVVPIVQARDQDQRTTEVAIAPSGELFPVHGETVDSLSLPNAKGISQPLIIDFQPNHSRGFNGPTAGVIMDGETRYFADDQKSYRTFKVVTFPEGITPPFEDQSLDPTKDQRKIIANYDYVSRKGESALDYEAALKSNLPR